MSDVIRFTCPACGQKYRAPTRLAGRRRTCVRCGTPYAIPSQEAAVPEPQHLAVGAPAHAAGDESLARIPPAGPISQFAAALSESHAEAKAQTDAIAESGADTNTDTAPLIEDHADTHVETAPLADSHAESLSEDHAETLPASMAEAEVKAAARQPDAVPEPPAPERHPCPFCGEDILRAALKCKHCGEFLSGSPRPAEAPPPVHEPDTRAIAEALAKAELSAADARARAQRAAADARAKADEVAAVARRNGERIAAINRQIEMQAESDYRQVLLRAADSLSAAEKSAVSQCRFYSDVYHAVERMGIDPVAAMNGSQYRGDGHDPAARDTLSVITHVMDLIGNPPPRFRRAYEKTIEAFAAYGQMDELSRTPPTDMVAREASLADLHSRFAASMADMRGLLRSSGA